MGGRVGVEGRLGAILGRLYLGYLGGKREKFAGNNHVFARGQICPPGSAGLRVTTHMTSIAARSAEDQARRPVCE